MASPRPAFTRRAVGHDQFRTRWQGRAPRRTTDLSDEALKAAVQRSEELAGFAPANPEYVEPLGPQKYADYDNWDEATAHARSPQMVPHVKSIIDGAAAKKLIAAGYFERSADVSAFGK